MIIAAILIIIFSLVSVIVSMIPVLTTATGQIGNVFTNFLSIGIYFFGASTFSMVISSVVMWYVAQATWACIEWTYKKIPGVN